MASYSFGDRTLKLIVIPVGLAVLLILAARAFGPVRPLQDVVAGRLSRDGVHAEPSENNPIPSSRIAAISWEINNREVYVSMSPRGSNGSVAKRMEFDGIKADLLADDFAGSKWVFPCRFNTCFSTMDRWT